MHICCFNWFSGPVGNIFVALCIYRSRRIWNRKKLTNSSQVFSLYLPVTGSVSLDLRPHDHLFVRVACSNTFQYVPTKAIIHSNALDKVNRNVCEVNPLFLKIKILIIVPSCSDLFYIVPKRYYLIPNRSNKMEKNDFFYYSPLLFWKTISSRYRLF